MSKSKPKNGKPSSQDYMNLLYTDSESDTVPDLKLPPLKGKKPKRRSTTQRSSTEDTNLCSPWVILKVVIVTAILCSIVGLGVVTYWSLQQITELKDQINALENKNAGTPEEFEALKMKLLMVNKSMADMKSGKYGLDALNQSIAEILKQIASLQATTSQLKQSDQSSDSTDKERKALADTVASIGSNLNSAQTDLESVKAKQTEFGKQLEAAENRLTVLENPGGRESGSSAPVSADLQDLLSQINATFTQGMSKVVTDVSRLQTHLDALDKFTQTMQEQMSNLSRQVANVSQTHAQWQGSNTKVTEARPEDEATQAVSTESLHELEDRMEHLQDTLEKIQTAHNNLTQGGSTATDGTSLAVGDTDIQTLKKEHTDFLLFKTEVFQDITSLNASLATVNESVSALNTDVESLFAKMNLAMTEVSNVTSVVEGLTQFLQTQKEAKADRDATKPTASEGKESTLSPQDQDLDKSTTTSHSD